MVFIDHSDQTPEWKLIPSDWVLVGCPREMSYWPAPLQCHKATAGWDSPLIALGWQCSVWSPELLAVLCFVHRKTKPFTQLGKRSLPRLVANMLQSSSAVLISASALVWAKHTWAYGSSLVFLSHPELQASCFHFWSLYRPIALLCVCVCSPSSPAWHWAAQAQRGRGGSSEKSPQPHWCQKSHLSPTDVSSQRGRRIAKQWLWCECCAQHWCFVFFTTLGACGSWGYHTYHNPAAAMEQLQGFARGRTACSLSFWGFSYKRLMRCGSYMHLVSHFARAITSAITWPSLWSFTWATHFSSSTFGGKKGKGRQDALLWACISLNFCCTTFAPD